jgi:hypothetical protein
LRRWDVARGMAEATLPEKPAEAGSAFGGHGILGLKPQATRAPSVLKHATLERRVIEMTLCW